MLSTISGVESSLGDGEGVGPTSRKTKRYVDCWLESDEWSHVAIVIRDYEDMSHYLNGRNNGGEYDGSGDVMTYGDGITVIGAEFFTNSVGHFFNGKMADLQIYDRALTEQEIAALVNKECL